MGNGMKLLLVEKTMCIMQNFDENSAVFLSKSIDVGSVILLSSVVMPDRTSLVIGQLCEFDVVVPQCSAMLFLIRQICHPPLSMNNGHVIRQRHKTSQTKSNYSHCS